MNVYIVITYHGRPSAVFADEDAAKDYCRQARARGNEARVLRTPLHYGQQLFPQGSTGEFVEVDD